MPECTIKQSFSIMEQQQLVNSGITFKTHPSPSTLWTSNQPRLLVTNLTFRYSRTLRLENSFENQWPVSLPVFIQTLHSSFPLDFFHRLEGVCNEMEP